MTGITVLALGLLYGVMTATAGRLGSETSASVATVGSKTQTTDTPTATPSETQTSTATPTKIVQSACPAAGCPYQLTPTGTWQIDQIWYGQSPPHSGANGSNLPVLVFVPGLTSIPPDWWTDSYGPNGINDMYLLAYNAGYRTAFASLIQGTGRGPDSDEYVNGKTLSTQLISIVQHYQVPNVVVITHSKGGIDLQDAIVAQGVSKLVSTAFLLSAPNNGSPLANIECTPSPTSLSAVCSLEPQNMAVFRATADPQLVKDKVPMYVSGGTDHGPPGSLLYVSGGILNRYGSNDGFVVVTSSVTLVNSQYLFVRSYSHDTIRMGHNSLPFILQVLREGTPQAVIPTPLPTGTPNH